MSEYSKQLRVEASRLGNLLSDKEKYTNRRRRTFRRRIHILLNAAAEIEELEATIKELEQDALCFDYMKLKKRIKKLEATIEQVRDIVVFNKRDDGMSLIPTARVLKILEARYDPIPVP